MSYFLSKDNLSVGDVFEIKSAEAGHIIKSRRMVAGDTFKVQDAAGRKFNARLDAVSKGHIKAKVLLQEESTPEPQIKVIILQALVKEKALDYILQKCTELGAHEIVIFNAGLSPIKLKTKGKIHLPTA